MRRDDAVYLRHILDAATSIRSYVSGLDEASFTTNALVIDAVIRQLEIIGEATKHLSTSFRSSHAQAPWHVAAAMRDKLIHDYMGVEPAIVWQTATVDLPQFADQVLSVLQEIDGATRNPGGPTPRYS
jgi:uncharacterized protein with HEPN domain